MFMSHVIGGMVTNDRMRTALGLSKAEAERMRKTAEIASAAKTDFLSNMSHELRTPLTSILGYSEILAASGDINDTSKGYIVRIHLAGKILLGTINDILDFTRIGSGEIELDPTPCDVVALASEVVAVSMIQATTKGVGLRLDVKTTPPGRLMLDELRLRQILLNLVANAVKFTPIGEVVLHLDYSEGDNRLACVVSDTGIGIPEDRLTRLFKRFSQVDASTTRTFGGTGLGLAICKGLVDKMGGEIGVESVVDQGSRFHFAIPAPPCVEHAAHAIECEVDSDLLRYARVLVVDDNPEITDLIRVLLEARGANVAVADDGDSALLACDDDRFDVILTDLHMPKMDGLQLAGAIRGRGDANSAIPIIAITADAAAQPSGDFDGLILKPITPSILVQTLCDQLRIPSPVNANSQRDERVAS